MSDRHTSSLSCASAYKKRRWGTVYKTILTISGKGRRKAFSISDMTGMMPYNTASFGVWQALLALVIAYLTIQAPKFFRNIRIW